MRTLDSNLIQYKKKNTKKKTMCIMSTRKKNVSLTYVSYILEYLSVGVGNS